MIGTRVASAAFPASAIVILASLIISGFTGYEVPEEGAAAATGLLTWAAFVVLGAGARTNHKP